MCCCGWASSSRTPNARPAWRGGRPPRPAAACRRRPTSGSTPRRSPRSAGSSRGRPCRRSPRTACAGWPARCSPAIPPSRRSPAHRPPADAAERSPRSSGRNQKERCGWTRYAPCRPACWPTWTTSRTCCTAAPPRRNEHHERLRARADRHRGRERHHARRARRRDVLGQHLRRPVLHQRRATAAVGPRALLRPGPARAVQDVLAHRRLGARVPVGPDRVAAAGTADRGRPARRRPEVGHRGRAGGPARRRLARVDGGPRTGRGGHRQRHRRGEALQHQPAHRAPDVPACAATGAVVRGAARTGTDRGARGGSRAVRRRLPRRHRGHHAGRAGQHHRRPGGQPVQLPRPQLHHRRGLRFGAGRHVIGGTRTAGARLRRGGHRRRGPEHGRVGVREVLQDRCAVRDRYPPVRCRRRRVRHGRGRGAVRAQAPRRRRARRRPDLRRPAGDRRLQRRAGQGHHRAEPGRPAPGGRARLGERRHQPGFGVLCGGSWYLDAGRRCRRAVQPDRGVRQGRRRAGFGRARLGEVQHRPPQGGGRHRRAIQDGDEPAPQGARPEPELRRTEPERGLGRDPVPGHHLAARVAGAAAGWRAFGRGERVRLRRHQLPCRDGGVRAGPVPWRAGALVRRRPARVHCGPPRRLEGAAARCGRGAAPKVAFLHTGQGSQYVNMLRPLRDREPIVADAFAEADRIMTPLLGRPLTSYIFVDGADEAAVREAEQQLLQTEITQPAVLTADLALTEMLAAYGIEPDMVMGHSLGEYGALVAAGALSFEGALEAVSARGREMAHLEVPDRGAMAAVFGPLEEIERIVAGIDGYVVIANVNSTGQAVVGGATEAVGRAVAALEAAGLTARRIPVSHAFHTSIVAPASAPLMDSLRRLDLHTAVRPIVSNVTGSFYPADADLNTMLQLLGRQVASPVQFVAGLRTLYDAGARVFVEVGPKKALHGFVEDVLGASHDDVLALFTNHPKLGDEVAFNQALCGLYAAGLGYPAAAAPVALIAPPAEPATELAAEPAEEPAAAPEPVRTAMTPDRYTELGRLFAGVLEQGLRLYQGAPARQPDGLAPATAEPVVITGAALGLPGVDRVFDDDNVARILEGQQLIDTIPHKLRRSMVDHHITRLVKRESGDPTFETIDREADVIKLAGRHAPFDVVAEFGVDAARDAALDVTTRLAIGAGFDALRDAGIPLVMHYKTTTLGTSLPDRWGLPDSMRDDTGVVFASAFPAYDNFVRDLEGYFIDRGRREQLLALEAVRTRMRGGEPAVVEVDRRIAELRRLLAAEPYVFDRRFLFRCLSMGHAQFAEIIGARGPNTQINAACASTTQALCLAEDWIRAGRCRRVIVVSADDATSDALLPWLGSGFLASGAAATDDVVEEAATPFDRRRHGMILGMGAAALLVESAQAARERGIQPICEVLGAVTANSAFHGTRLDVQHIGQIMEDVVSQAEAHGVDRHAIAAETMFVSHETYTPARGGSAAAEINALRQVFGPDADSVVITNTKGFTGHAMGAGVEDVVAVKGLETGIVPPVPNFKEPDPELGRLNLSAGGAYPVRYALRLAAGFGSQIALALLRWTPLPDGRHRAPDQLGYAYRIVDPAAWQRWLDRVSDVPGARLEVAQRRLRVVDTGAAPVTVPAAAPVTAPAVAVPAAAPVVAPVAAPVAAPAAADDDVVSTVVQIVSRLTGYPPELLDVDLDLEADLGVDTVKQAEVFAAVCERYDIPRDDNLRLRDFPTLTHVIGWIRDNTGTQAPVGPAPSPETTETTETTVTVHTAVSVAGDLAATDALPRRVPGPALRPDLPLCAPTGVHLGEGGRVVVMLDEGGVGEVLAARLRRLGAEVLTLEPGVASDEVVTRIDEWRGGASVQGVYWLPALDDEGPWDELDLAGWREALRRRVGALYTTMRRLYEYAPFLVTGTRLGGYHGYDDAGATCPLGGAVTGFAKAYRKEKEQAQALVKAVDFALSRKTAALADLLVEETLRDPGCVEVGYADGMRWGVGLAEQPFGDGTGGQHRLRHHR